LYRTLCLKNKNWFLTTDDYTSLYLQYTYVASIIYKCTYKKEDSRSQMRERFVSRLCGRDNSSFSDISPKIRIRLKMLTTKKLVVNPMKYELMI